MPLWLKNNTRRLRDAFNEHKGRNIFLIIISIIIIWWFGIQLIITLATIGLIYLLATKFTW